MKMLTTAQVAEMIGVSESTLRWWRHAGRGPKSFNLSRRKVMYRLEDIEAWMAEQYESTVQGGAA